MKSMGALAVTVLSSLSLSQAVSAQTGDAVAPGEGALHTCSAFGPGTIMKSSTSAPLVAIACARTPLPPGCKMV